MTTLEGSVIVVKEKTVDGSDLKKLWKTGKPSFGTWVTLADPAVCAILANIGFEWVIIDGEHCPFNPETLRNMLLVLRERGVVSIVRVRLNDESLVKQALDWGAEGIMFPFIRTADDARRAAAACRYPPAGVRGFNPRDASNYYTDIEHYLATADDRVVAILQVEHVDAVNNLDAILAVPGVDALLIGPSDLSFSLGAPRQFQHPDVQAAIHTTIRKANAAGVPLGMFWHDTVEGYKAYLARGLTFIPLGIDYEFIKVAGAEMLNKMRGS